jgi:hypothetical protein
MTKTVTGLPPALKHALNILNANAGGQQRQDPWAFLEHFHIPKYQNVGVRQKTASAGVD